MAALLPNLDFDPRWKDTLQKETILKPRLTFINTTCVAGFLLLFSVMIYPSLIVAWITSLIFASSLYALHERYSFQESIRFFGVEAWSIRKEGGLRWWATLAVALLGGLFTLFYALYGGTEFAMIIATAVGLTLVLRAILPRYFDHSEIRSLT